MGVEVLLHVRIEAGAIGALDPKRIARYESFAECDEVSALLAGLVDPVDDLGKSRIALEPDRSDLAQRDG